jgi:NADH-quinone oxidoreductase subunit L
MSLVSLTWALVLTPLGTAILAGFGHKLLGRLGVQILTTGGVLIAFFLACFLTFLIFWQEITPWQVQGFTWYLGGGITFAIGLWVDRLTVVMMMVVTSISLLVHFYSIAYMQQDAAYRRFFSYISLFTFAMLVLVGADNFLQLFFGWEAVGLISYLLIGFWFDQPAASRGSLKAFLVNRIGDFGFLLGIALLFKSVSSLHYADVWQAVPALKAANIALFGMNFPLLTVIGILLFIGAMGKSAQIPLHVWLPESMAGPTPVSALIHAATMVTAGVYMVSRHALIFEYAEGARLFILTVGASTALLMGIVALVQTDIKRVIAFSTLSQLGYMVAALGVSAYTAAIFHLTTHAFFKALLFLSAGSVILALHHEQAIAKMGGLWKRLPVTYVCFLIGALALVALPPFSGYYSKDAIIEAVYEANSYSYSAVTIYAFYCLLASVFITAIYTSRLVFLVFHGKPTQPLPPRLKEPFLIKWPLIVLAIPSIFIGKILIASVHKGQWLGANIFQQAPAAALLKPADSLGGIPTLIGLLGVLTAWVIYFQWPRVAARCTVRFPRLYHFILHQYGIDAWNQRVLVGGAQRLARQCANLDKHVVDHYLIQGVVRISTYLATCFRRLHTGYLNHYLFLMILAILGFLLSELICA